MFVKLQQNLNKIFIFLYFFLVPSNYSNYVILGYFGISFFFFLGELLFEKNAFLNKKILVLFTFLALILFVGIVFSPYSMVNAISSFIFLFISFFSYYRKKDSVFYYSSFRFDWFYWAVLISIVTHLMFALVSEGFGITRFYISGGAWDVNVFSLVLFAFFAYCDAKHYKMWFPIAVFTIVFCRGSRGCLFIFALFALIKVIKLLLSKNKLRKKTDSKNATYQPFLIICLAVAVTICFSYFWTYVISTSNVLYYHEGLNDGSNAVRFRSNIFALEQVFRTTDFIFYGYDNDIRLLIGDISPEESAMFMGYRLVQSHNSIINMFMKNGILFAGVYVVLLCILLRRFFDKNRLEYWLPYLFGSMILHSMFSLGYLLIFVISLSVVSSPTANYKRLRFGRSFQAISI